LSDGRKNFTVVAPSAMKQKPKVIIIMLGAILFGALCIAAGVSVMKSRNASAKIKQLESDKKELQCEKEWWKTRYDSLDAVHVSLFAKYTAQIKFADSMRQYLSRFGQRIVLIHENDSIVGSMDIGGQLRAYTDFLAAADSLQ